MTSTTAKTITVIKKSNFLDLGALDIPWSLALGHWALRLRRAVLSVDKNIRKYLQ